MSECLVYEVWGYVNDCRLRELCQTYKTWIWFFSNGLNILHYSKQKTGFNPVSGCIVRCLMKRSQTLWYNISRCNFILSFTNENFFHVNGYRCYYFIYEWVHDIIQVNVGSPVCLCVESSIKKGDRLLKESKLLRDPRLWVVGMKIPTSFFNKIHKETSVVQNKRS